MKYYVVWKGKQPGVYESWEDCRQQIEGFPHPVYKSFKDKAMAHKAIQEGWELYIGFDERKLAFSDEQRAIVGEPIAESLSVDAACSGNPGVMEYRGVYTGTGRELFMQGPFQQGTVNIGEFLALVHALAYLKKKNSRMPVYSDSRTAISWVKKKRANTKLKRNPVNEQLFQLVDRAVTWLDGNTYKNPVLKWETKYWGEIPADFGRK
ncbi:MAG: viroplasmin family protein [Bacteroidales bacterium]